MILPDEDNVVRYVRPGHVLDDETVDGSEFRLRPGELGFSVNWLECFRSLPKDEQLGQVRRLAHLSRSANWRLAELNVGETIEHISSHAKLSFVNRPSLPNARYPFKDPTHTEIDGLPPGDSLEAALIGDMIAQCIQDMHPAV